MCARTLKGALLLGQLIDLPHCGMRAEDKIRLHNIVKINANPRKVALWLVLLFDICLLFIRKKEESAVLYAHPLSFENFAAAILIL